MEQEEPPPQTETKVEAEPEGDKTKNEGEADAVVEEGEAPKPPAAPQFEFNFDDEEKKKKKPKKSKKDKKKQKPLNREYYETLIIALNHQLADLRKIFVRKDEDNLKLAHELAVIEEDRHDVCEHLDRVLNKREITIVSLEETYEKLQKEFKEYKETSHQRIDELRKQYESVEKQLKGEIELQERALHSLDEFRVQRDSVLDRYQATHEYVEDMERQCKEDLFNLEQTNTVLKNVLKKEVKLRLNQLADDFLRSIEIRNAGYTRNLIRENDSLHKTLDRQVKKNISIMEEREKQFLKTKEVMESYSSLEQFTEHLQHTIDNKDVIIKRLASRIESMKTKLIDARRYQNLCDRAIEKDLFKRPVPQNLNDMQAHLEQLKTDKHTLQWTMYQQEPEIERLRQVLEKLYSAVMLAAEALHTLDDTMSESDIMEMQQILRQNIVAELIPIVSDSTAGVEVPNEKQQPHETAIFRPGLCGLIPTQAQYAEKSITELCNNVKAAEFWAATASKESTSLYGLEFGSCCYYSHTPTIQSSSMLLPIVECSSESDEEEIPLGLATASLATSSSVAEKYKQQRCSCPKKKSSIENESASKIIFKEPTEKLKPRPGTFGRCQAVNCFGLASFPYCSDISVAQDEKTFRSAKASPSAATIVSFQTTFQVDGDQKKEETWKKGSCNC